MWTNSRAKRQRDRTLHVCDDRTLSGYDAFGYISTPFRELERSKLPKALLLSKVKLLELLAVLKVLKVPTFSRRVVPKTPNAS